MQVQADLLGIPVVRPRVAETTALGAAFLAGSAVGVRRGADDLASAWVAERRFEPRPSPDHALRRAAWARAVERSRGWAP
jgi:glycerol kinase